MKEQWLKWFHEKKVCGGEKYEEVLNQLNKLLMVYAGQSHQKTTKCGHLEIQPGKAKTAEEQFLMLLAKVIKPMLTIKKGGEKKKPGRKFYIPVKSFKIKLF